MVGVQLSARQLLHWDGPRLNSCLSLRRSCRRLLLRGALALQPCLELGWRELRALLLLLLLQLLLQGRLGRVLHHRLLGGRRLRQRDGHGRR